LSCVCCALPLISLLLLFSLYSLGAADRRPDLAFLYYPPRSDYYWFFSRTVHALSVADPAVLARYPVFQFVVDTAGPLLRKHATTVMLADAKNDTSGHVFWDDFLGMADTDKNGNPAPTYEDRLFTTAITANALLDMWTTASSSCVAVWRSDVPSTVQTAVDGATSFLGDEILGEDYLPSNAFFSGSGKSFPWTISYAYPMTAAQYLNGTQITTDQQHNTPWSIFMLNTNIMSGVHGVLSESEYATMLTQLWGNTSVPIEPAPYGYNTTPFPYWNSNAITYAVTLRLLAKYQQLLNCGGGK